ncbi:cyclic nucleotide-binding domain-containing protein [Paenibacillus sp. Marseille-Q4541]|uniref:Crp/Fnr family transcriptional regulator n=1 Tax=Paenibacillus sp. Marseille-Q4541 TaxID=2831522 RepID=UPI001BABFAC7|nr:cyclic nucleotide-binding domain-containing protein [Paenibacillus sp. Marseille-Q4541]
MKEIMDRERINQYLIQYGLEDIFPEGLRQHLALYRFDSDEALCRQGEKPEFLFFLVQGKVKVYTTSAEGKTLLINFTTPFEAIGEIECLRDRENLNTVMAVTEVEAIGIHKRRLSQYEDEASFLRLLLNMVAQKFYTKSISLGSHLLYPVEVRLASYLLSVSPEEKNGAMKRVNMSSIKDMANLIGTSYRHLNRVLQKFSSEGLVERRRGTLVVKNREGLYAVAGQNIYEREERKEQG